MEIEIKLKGLVYTIYFLAKIYALKIIILEFIYFVVLL